MHASQSVPKTGVEKNSALRQRSGAIGLGIAGIGLVLAGFAIALLSNHVNSGASLASELSAIPIQVQTPAPDLALNDIFGAEGNLRDFLGRVVLVNLWATWCPPCKAEIPVFQAFYAQHQAAGLTVLAINDGESADAVRQFVNEWGVTFPVWLDPMYLASEHAFRTSSLPASFVIDRNGTVRLRWIGAIDASNLDKYVLPLLEE